MKANNIQVVTNFTSVFANLSTQEELKEVANIIRAELISAVNNRQDEIAKDAKVISVVAEVKSDAAPQSKTENKKSAMAKAKEVAAKLKSKRAEPKAEAKPKAEHKHDDDTLIAITDTAAIKKLGLTFEKYNDKCWVLRGDTKPLRKALKEEFKGVYNSRLTGGEGWVFRTAHAQECAKALGLKVKVA